MTAPLAEVVPPTPEVWQLFVDETGAFDAADVEESFVVGLLVRAEDTPSSRASMREALQSAFATVPWPPHATDLNVPAWRPYLHAAGSTAGAAQTDPRVAKAARALASCEAFRAAVGPSARSRRDLRAALEAASHWLRKRQPDLVSELEALAVRERAEAARRIRAVLGSPPGRAWLVVAAARPVDEPVRLGAQLTTDPYVDALETLLERVHLLVASHDHGEASERAPVVWCHVATRSVEGAGASNARTEVGPEAVGELIGRARLHGRPVRGRDVTLRAARQVYRYDAGVHPGIVAADVLANGAHHELARKIGRGTSWDEVRDRIAGSLAARVTIDATRLGPEAQSLSSIAAAGVARRHIAACRGPEQDPALARERWLWARQQAIAWSRALRASGGLR